MEYLRVFETQSEYTSLSNLPNPCISYIEELDGVIFKSNNEMENPDINHPTDEPITPEPPVKVGNSFVATYELDSAGNVQILGISDTLLNMFDKMIINGVEMAPAQTHTFNKTGEVEVQWVLKDGYTSFMQLFEECYSLLKLDFSNCDMSNVVNMTSMLQGCEGVNRMTFSGPINANVECLDMFGSSMNGSLYYEQAYESIYAPIIAEANNYSWSTNAY